MGTVAKHIVAATMRDDLEMSMGIANRQIGDVAVDLHLFPDVQSDATAFNVAHLLGEIEETLLIVRDGNRATGFITFESLQQPAFNLPLFGLLLELEEGALQWAEVQPQQCWNLLSEGPAHGRTYCYIPKRKWVIRSIN